MPGLKLPPRIWNKRCLVKNYLNETGHFHKYSPNYRSAYVTLQNFTPGLQKNYTDISAISVTFRNSGGMVPNSAPPPRKSKFLSINMTKKVIIPSFRSVIVQGCLIQTPPPRNGLKFCPPMEIQILSIKMTRKIIIPSLRSVIMQGCLFLKISRD